MSVSISNTQTVQVGKNSDGDDRNPETRPWRELNVLGFCSHKPNRYPSDRSWLASFSNWYPCTFLLREDETVGGENDDNSMEDERAFNCVEQWMMWKKARRYGDQDAALRIMATSDPAEMKRIGRGVRGYQHRDWCAVRYEIVLRGIKAKFEQDPELKENLVGTGHQTLAEAATYDTVWGIGLHRTDPRTQDPNQWKGLNLLGKALMEARDTL